MQIGHGKQGVIVGEYGCERAPSGLVPKRHGETRQDHNEVVGWLEPACDSPAWIIWFTRQGDAIIYPHRENTGGITGYNESGANPIRLSADGLKQKAVFYGPHACEKCGVQICKMGNGFGHDAYTYPEGPIYPNTEWVPHVCRQRDIERVNGLLSIGFRKPGDAAPETSVPSSPPKSDN